MTHVTLHVTCAAGTGIATCHSPGENPEKKKLAKGWDYSTVVELKLSCLLCPCLGLTGALQSVYYIV